MQVFKFGGASVKDSAAIENITNILKGYKSKKIVIVISAMGKTTNALENLYQKHLTKENYSKELEIVKNFHSAIIEELFGPSQHPVWDLYNNTIDQLEEILSESPIENHAFQYDQIVSFGELLSTKIISHYLYDNGVDNRWINAKKIIRTDNRYREAGIQWEQTDTLIKRNICNLFEETDIVITQGFIGATSEKLTTTLGREGSDYTAAIIGAALNSESVTVWKDVPGILTGDPKKFPGAVLMPQISYNEAIEMTYYGAKVLHPRTIKPLENKGIPLYVKSFVEPDKQGTKVEKLTKEIAYKPITIIEENQVAIALETKELNFFSEEDLSFLYGQCAKYQVKINLMQHSATKLKLITDNKPYKNEPFSEAISDRFEVEIMDKMELLTIRHYSYDVIYELTKEKQVFVESKSQNTYQLVFKN